jgi:ABC-2 type transport system ATP-binding protein
VDTPDNLTARLTGMQTIYLQVEGDPAQVLPVLERVTGVVRAAVADKRDGVVGYEIDSERGHDIRRDLAPAIVGHGWSLLEMRPLRMSLEEIFLHLTTEESEEEAEAAHG